MNKVLFITNRNILTACGELRLVKNRAESLFYKFGIKSDFLVLQKKSRVGSDKIESIDAGGEFTTIGFSGFDYFWKMKELEKAIKNILKYEQYKCVIFSGIGMAYFSKMIKRIKNTKIIIDIHGASEDILELAGNCGFKKKLYFKALYKMDTNCLKNSCQYADGFFVVTDALEQYIKSRYKVSSKAYFYKVPCATMLFSLNDNDYEKNREIYRKKYAIENDTLVFVYSGGISHWQCIDEMIDLYKKISINVRRKTVMLLFSYEIEQMKYKIKGSKTIIADSYSSNELCKALCAGDFAFLLRKDCITNKVAFPNKFLEYVQARLKIITTPYIEEIAIQITNGNIGIQYDLSDDISQVLRYIEQYSRGKILKKEIDSILKYNSFETRLMKFFEDISEK